MPKNKHLSLAERYAIEHSLKKKWSFKAMARELQRDCTTISKEVRNHRVFKKTGDYGHSFNDCIHRSKCDVRNLCDPCPNKRLHFCSYCKHCIPNCSDYKPHTCPRREKPPYVCNGCNDLRMCFLEKLSIVPVMHRTNMSLFALNLTQASTFQNRKPSILTTSSAHLFKKANPFITSVPITETRSCTVKRPSITT